MNADFFHGSAPAVDLDHIADLKLPFKDQKETGDDIRDQIIRTKTYDKGQDSGRGQQCLHVEAEHRKGSVDRNDHGDVFDEAAAEPADRLRPWRKNPPQKAQPLPDKIHGDDHDYRHDQDPGNRKDMESRLPLPLHDIGENRRFSQHRDAEDNQEKEQKEEYGTDDPDYHRRLLRRGFPFPAIFPVHCAGRGERIRRNFFQNIVNRRSCGIFRLAQNTHSAEQEQKDREVHDRKQGGNQSEFSPASVNDDFRNRDKNIFVVYHGA